MYYEEKWVAGKLYWRSTPTGEWIEADAAKLSRALEETQKELNELRDTVIGWRERDWPEGFDRRTAELIAEAVQ